MDGMTGTVLGVDMGAGFYDNVMRLYTEEKAR